MPVPAPIGAELADANAIAMRPVYSVTGDHFDVGRRFAKALYLKSVPRVRIAPSPLHLALFRLIPGAYESEPLHCRRRSLAKLNEP